MSPITVGIIGILVLIGLLFTRMPVGFVMALVGVLGFSYMVNFKAALNILGKDIFGTFGSYSFTVIPLFVLMGQIAFHSGVSRKLFDTAYTWFGHLRGGMAIATVWACAAFGAICGSTTAAAATMATVALNEMKRFGYERRIATGTVAAGGSLGILIPPSVIFIVYGIATEQSIGKLFLSGILPGILLSGVWSITIWIWAKMRPEGAPTGSKSNWKERFKSLKGVWETLVLFFLVMGGLFAGFFTPTEAGAVGAGGALLLALLRRSLSWEGFKKALTESTQISCMVLMIVAGAMVFGHFLAITRVPYEVAEWASHLPLPRWGIMAFIILIYLIGGCFLDALALILLTIPIFYPVVTALGFDPLWFGVIIVLVTQMGVITPPVGVNVYVVGGIARDVPLEEIFKGALPFLIGLVITSLILIPFPKIALLLPSLVK